MKRLMTIALTLCSFAVFSAENNAVDSLLSVLPVGNHNGKDCVVNVNVAEFPVRSAFVKLSNDKNSILKIVSEGSEFFFEDYKREFIQTEYVTIDDTRSSSVERIIRTVMVDEKQTYVVVEEAVTVNRERRSDIVECVVSI